MLELGSEPKAESFYSQYFSDFPLPLDSVRLHLLRVEFILSLCRAAFLSPEPLAQVLPPPWLPPGGSCVHISLLTSPSCQLCCGIRWGLS